MTKAVSRRAFLRTASQMSVLGSATPLALNLAAMGFPQPYVRKRKNPTTRSTHYAPATNPGRRSDSTPRPYGRRMGAICWFPLPGGDGVDY